MPPTWFSQNWVLAWREMTTKIICCFSRLNTIFIFELKVFALLAAMLAHLDLSTTLRNIKLIKEMHNLVSRKDDSLEKVKRSALYCFPDPHWHKKASSALKDRLDTKISLSISKPTNYVRSHHPLVQNWLGRDSDTSYCDFFNKCAFTLIKPKACMNTLFKTNPEITDSN